MAVVAGNLDEAKPRVATPHVRLSFAPHPLRDPVTHRRPASLEGLPQHRLLRSPTSLLPHLAHDSGVSSSPLTRLGPRWCNRALAPAGEPAAPAVVDRAQWGSSTGWYGSMSGARRLTRGDSFTMARASSSAVGTRGVWECSTTFSGCPGLRGKSSYRPDPLASMSTALATCPTHHHHVPAGAGLHAASRKTGADVLCARCTWPRAASRTSQRSRRQCGCASASACPSRYRRTSFASSARPPPGHALADGYIRSQAVDSTRRSWR